tara:strand:- start:540 stop:725 length:186 start_codon:yes stop_codon:yes gene_type:complete
MKNSKKWYKSWTMWANIAAIVAFAVADVMELIPGSASYAGYVISIGNLALRIKTTSAVTWK